MALASRCKAPAAVSAGRSRRSVKVSAHKGAFEQVQVAAAAVAAAALLASPANAGVVLQQPELKKVFQDDAPAPAPVKREFKGLAPPALPSAVEAPKPAAAAPAEKKKEVVSEQGNDLDPRSIALPGALALTIGGFFAASKIDTSFNEWFIEAVVKDSNNYAGYEATLKTDAGVVFPKAAVAGTKKVKAATGSKKGGFPFGGKK
ncbi:hypothetical protein PLESTB_001237600 [Pleodorina starrii]|uniref:Uncharacterized protein n=1 Tax=Pleodorina starrii TaxID=330485 RepID=A0A9W6BSU9_9CHLO|nr:hypothetical protein PLESTM_000222200 [Pleodorina starrii]GLC57533.1 hypothetical protein PLESTB_001237600 [Pleodorina starrii]GLC63205.1 hypothetical protein PLESTF_000011600 [Pleodorina starrii]